MIAQSFTPPPRKDPRKSPSPRRVLAPVHDRSSFTPKKRLSIEPQFAIVQVPYPTVHTRPACRQIHVRAVMTQYPPPPPALPPRPPRGVGLGQRVEDEPPRPDRDAHLREVRARELGQRRGVDLVLAERVQEAHEVEARQERLDGRVRAVGVGVVGRGVVVVRVERDGLDVRLRELGEDRLQLARARHGVDAGLLRGLDGRQALLSVFAPMPSSAAATAASSISSRGSASPSSSIAAASSSKCASDASAFSSAAAAAAAAWRAAEARFFLRFFAFFLEVALAGGAAGSGVGAGGGGGGAGAARSSATISDFSQHRLMSTPRSAAKALSAFTLSPARPSSAGSASTGASARSPSLSIRATADDGAAATQAASSAATSSGRVIASVVSAPT